MSDEFITKFLRKRNFGKGKLMSLLVMWTLLTKSQTAFHNLLHTGLTCHPQDGGFVVMISLDWIGTLKLELQGSIIHSQSQEPFSFSILSSRDH